MKTSLGNVFRIIRVIIVILLLVFVFFMFRKSGGSDAKFSDVEAKVLEVADTENMLEAEGRMVKRIYGLNAGDYEGLLLYYPTTNMGAEELFLVKIKSDDQREQVLNAINSRLEKQKKSFDGYGVEQTKMLEESILDDRGNYILFVVGEKAGEIDKAFKDSL